MGEKHEGFDRVFDLVGGHGMFQWRLLLITSLQLVIVTWHHIGYTFLGAVPDHWCKIDVLSQTNWTIDEIKELSIPKLVDQRDPNLLVFDKCKQYYINYDSLVSTSFSYDEAYSKVDFMNATTTGCEKWDYDRSVYQMTVPMQFDLVCGRRWLVATIQSSYMAGGLIGTLLIGSISDKFLGRRKTVLSSLAIVVIVGTAAAFAKTYWMFLLLRFILSIGVAGSMQNCFVLVMEHGDIKGRALFGLFVQVPFAVGYMILPILAYFIRDWSNLQLAFGLTSFSVIAYYWILPYSPRWLATHGKDEMAVDCLQEMAKVNKMSVPSREELLEIIRPCHQRHKIPGIDEESSEEAEVQIQEPTKFKERFEGVFENFKNLIKTAEIRKRSFVFWTMFLIVSMVYYGLVFAGNLTSDPYLIVFLGGLMEIPACTVIVPFVSKLGRKPTISGTFIITGICMIILSQIPASYESIRIILALSAKLFISSAFAIIYLLGAELYPTEMRTTGLAVGMFMGRMGSITAPYIADLMQSIGRDFPTIIFGVSAIAAGVMSLGLPETKRLEMTDQVYEVEQQAEEERLKERRHSWIDVI